VVASSRRIDRVDPVGLGRKNKPESADKPKLEHRGLVVDLATGVLGCTRAMCAGSTGHDSSPGVFASGFFGGNVGGIVEVGLLGGWGQLQAHAGNGANPLTMWGLSPDLLSEGLSVRSGDAGGGTSDLLQQMHTQDVALTTFHAAPALRIHFVPRGRVIAFAGAAAGYGGLAGAYGTDLGRLRLRAHGVVVPAEAGLGVHLTKNIALVARFDYLWMKYLLLGFEHSLQSGVVPVSMASKYSTVDLDDALPDFWAVTVGLRVRLF
jgi:hypothetical protein